MLTTGLTVAVLAGGKSLRMGTDKALLPLRGKAMLTHILERTAQLQPQRTILIANRSQQYNYFDVPIYQDVITGQGALGGIYSAIYHSRTRYVLVVACDMPLINVGLLRHMVSLTAGEQYDAIVPRKAGFPQGLYTIYNKRCMATIHAQMRANRLKLSAMLHQLNVRYVDEPEWQTYDPQGISFTNLNTPEALFAALGHL